MSKPIPHTPFLQADSLIDGIRHCSYCQVGENGETYMFADFEGSECVRIGHNPARHGEAVKFFQAVCAIVGADAKKVIARLPGSLVVKPIIA